MLEVTVCTETSLDLNELVLDELIVTIPVGMQVTQDLVCVLLTTFVHQPTWGFVHETAEDEGGDNDTADTLKNARDTPCPDGLEVKKTEAQPGGDGGTNVVDTLHVSQRSRRGGTH